MRKLIFFFIVLKDNSVKFSIFKLVPEFLSCYYDANGIEEAAGMVSYTTKIKINIPLSYLQSNPGSLCFLENFSDFPSEKEVLLTSGNIFAIEKINKKILNQKNLYEINLLLVSSGMGKFDYLKYSKCDKANIYFDDTDKLVELEDLVQTIQHNEYIKEILLSGLENNIMNIDIAKKLGKALKANKTINTFIIKNSKFNLKEGVYEELAEFLCENYSVKSLIISEFTLNSKGIMAFAEALKRNKYVEKVDFSENEINDIAAGKIAELLESNVTITELSLEKNLIGDVGAEKIFAALKNNKTLKKINLTGNKITDEGAKFILNEYLNKNGIYINEIFLFYNNINAELSESISHRLKEKAKNEKAEKIDIRAVKDEEPQEEY